MCNIHKVGQNHTFIGMYGIFGREITIHTVIYGADIRFWPTLGMCIQQLRVPWARMCARMCVVVAST